MATTRVGSALAAARGAATRLDDHHGAAVARAAQHDEHAALPPPPPPRTWLDALAPPSLRAQRTLLLTAVGLAVLIAAVAATLMIRAKLRRDVCAPTDDTEWSAWSECSAPCSVDGGLQYRVRSIARLPANGGATCSAAQLVQSRSCNVGATCTDEPCVPGNPDAYGWSACPVCVDGDDAPVQFKIVPPSREAVGGGAPCALEDVFFTRACSASDGGPLPSCPQPIDCTVSDEPYASTSCNARCGGGVQTLYYSISVYPQHGGAPCDPSLLVEQVACNTQACIDDCDAVLDAASWSDLTHCDASCGDGFQFKARLPLSEFDFCPTVQSFSCNLTPCPSPPHGDVVPPLEFVTALCYLRCAGMAFPPQPFDDGSGLTYYSVTEAWLDAVCGDADGAHGCAAPQDCVMGPWTTSGACSAGCDASSPQGGFVSVVRVPLSLSQNGGTDCADLPLAYQVPCNNLEGVSYSSVSADGGAFEAAYAAPDPACAVVDCTMSDWFAVGSCSVPCGTDGQQQFAALIVTPASGGGAPCPTDPSSFSMYDACDTCPGTAACDEGTYGPLAVPAACPACDWESWEEFWARTGCAETATCWSACSAECDGTMRSGPRGLAGGAALPPGTTCDTADAYTTTECNQDCVDTSQCYGASALPCSGHGSTVTTTDSSGRATCSCDCDAGFFGLTCEHHCSVSSGGEICDGLGDCSSVTGCVCESGFSGDACDVGGHCAVFALQTFSPSGGGSPRTAQLFLGFSPMFSNGGFDHAACRALSWLPPATLSGTAFAPNDAELPYWGSQSFGTMRVALRGEIMADPPSLSTLYYTDPSLTTYTDITAVNGGLQVGADAYALDALIDGGTAVGGASFYRARVPRVFPADDPSALADVTSLTAYGWVAMGVI